MADEEEFSPFTVGDILRRARGESNPESLNGNDPYFGLLIDVFRITPIIDPTYGNPTHAVFADEFGTYIRWKDYKELWQLYHGDANKIERID